MKTRRNKELREKGILPRGNLDREVAFQLGFEGVERIPLPKKKHSQRAIIIEEYIASSKTSDSVNQVVTYSPVESQAS